MKKDKAMPRSDELASKTRAWQGYAVAVMGTAIATGLRWLLESYVGNLPLYLMFYPVVFAAAITGGTGPGLLATALGAVAVDFFFTAPRGNLVLPETGQVVGVALFVAVNVGVSLLGGRLRRQTAALRERDTRLRLAHQVARSGTFDWNLETGISAWSPELEAMYGLKPGQYGGTGKAWEALIVPEDRPQAVASVERALKTFQTEEGEWRVAWPDGSVHCIVGRFQAFPGRDRKAARLVGINVDITDRKKAEEALRKREEWFRTVADVIPQQAWVAHPDGYIFWFNQRCFEYSGLTPEQMEGWAWRSRYSADVRALVEEQWRDAIAAGKPFEMEFPLRGADGKFRAFLTRVMPLHDEQGRLQFWFGTHTDISGQQEAREALRRSEEQLRALVLASSYVIYRMNKDWSVMRRLLGQSFIPDTEIPSRSWLEKYIPAEDQKRMIATIDEAIREKKVFELEHRVRRADGTIGWTFSRAIPLLDAQGEISEWFGAASDVTERKRLQEHLEEAVAERTAKLEETLAELEYMSYSMVHDMRAPLRAMQGFAVIMEEECEECRRPPVIDYIRRIRKSANRLDRLITDALNYNKVLREKLPLTPVDLGKLLRGMIESYPNLQPPAAEITVEFGELVVLGNESLLTQCCGNLLDNAVKFVARGVKPRIHVQAESSTLNGRDSIIVSVQDNGIGIPREAQEKIFRLFQRMHSSSEYPGTGIGLAIVKKAVERMNGRLGLESEPGRGSRFWIELPGAAQVEEPENVEHAFAE